MNVKNEFAKWFQPTIPDSYKSWLKKIDKRLDEINVAYISSFGNSLFDIDVNNIAQEILNIENNLNKKDKKFEDYDWSSAHGIPHAVINTHYINFLKNYTWENIIDESEQNELEKFYQKNRWSKADILKDLENLKEDDPEKATVNHKSYKRDNKTIAQIKILRDFKCQICSTTILKKDGTKYIEAAHIKAKHSKGRETLDNIILLCPNHHKEFDFGHLEVVLHDKEQITFILNGQRYKIKLSM